MFVQLLRRDHGEKTKPGAGCLRDDRHNPLILLSRVPRPPDKLSRAIPCQHWRFRQEKGPEMNPGTCIGWWGGSLHQAALKVRETGVPARCGVLRILAKSGG